MYWRMTKKTTSRSGERPQSPLGSARRTSRLNIRASAEQETLIREAAQRRGENLADFVLRSACVETKLTLGDKRNFTLPPERWRAFLEALDRPLVLKQQLQRLFSKESTLERSR